MGVQAEFTKDYLFYKIALLSISLYFLGTRNRSLGNLEKGYNFCVSASLFLKNFFTEECPVFQEIRENLMKMTQKQEDFLEKKKKKMRRNKSMGFNFSKINGNSVSFTKFKSVYERPHSEMRISPKKKVKRNGSHPSSYFRELKKRIVSPELKLNVE